MQIQLNMIITFDIPDEILYDIRQSDEWEKECRQIDIELEAVASEKERVDVLHAYEMWKWNFPKDIADRTERDLKQLRKARLEEQMKQLQKELSYLNGEDGE